MLPPEDYGYVLRIDNVSDPYVSKWVYNDPKTGEPKKPAIKTTITFTIVDYPNDDAANSVIGEWIRGYYSISMNVKANFYALAKAAFGGDVDPRWKPNRQDLEGKLVSAVLGHKPPNAEGKVYPVITQVLPYRGKQTYEHVAKWQPRDDSTVVEEEAPPF